MVFEEFLEGPLPRLAARSAREKVFSTTRNIACGRKHFFLSVRDFFFFVLRAENTSRYHIRIKEQ